MTLWESLKNLKWNQIDVWSVIKGCSNHYLVDWQKNPERIKQVQGYRLKICANCHMNNNGICDNTGERQIVNVETNVSTIGCGCNLECKTALLESNCPAYLWKGV